MTMNRLTERQPQDQQHARSAQQIERLVSAIERLERRFDQFAGAYLNARFPYGKPTDRWKRSA